VRPSATIFCVSCHCNRIVPRWTSWRSQCEWISTCLSFVCSLAASWTINRIVWRLSHSIMSGSSSWMVIASSCIPELFRSIRLSAKEASLAHQRGSCRLSTILNAEVRSIQVSDDSVRCFMMGFSMSLVEPRELCRQSRYTCK
jgi:hypothetical protein